MKICQVAFVIVILLFAPLTYAGIRPSFSLEHCAWQATHIVIATEGNKIDGKVTVLESWKGDLRAGEVISVPELASFKSQSSREVKSGIFDIKRDEPPKYVTGSRMILFLKKKDRPAEASNDPSRGLQIEYQWEPAANWGGMNVSVLWIEGEQSFAFIQVMNPGDSLLTHYGDSENRVRDRAFEVMHLHETVNEAVAIKDESKRAEALEAFTRSDLNYARDLAFAELEKCGQGAMPVLRKMLNDQSLLRLHSEVIKCLTVVGGDKVADELTTIVRDELGFWRATAPSLSTEWWNGGDDTEREMLRNRYSKVLEALYSLRKLRTVGCKDVVIEFRDFWRSLPQLEDKRGLTQMSEACDKILLELP